MMSCWVAGYKLGECLLVAEVDEFSEAPALSFLVSHCFTDAGGAFLQYEQSDFETADCSGEAMDTRNTTELDCDLQFECEAAAATPWTDLPPAVTFL